MSLHVVLQRLGLWMIILRQRVESGTRLDDHLSRIAAQKVAYKKWLKSRWFLFLIP